MNYIHPTYISKWRALLNGERFLLDACIDFFCYLEVHLQVAEPRKFHIMTDQTKHCFWT